VVLVWKQLEASAFRWPAIVNGVVRLTPLEFAALFDGIDWRRVQAMREIPKHSMPLPRDPITPVPVGFEGQARYLCR
jgi:transposase